MKKLNEKYYKILDILKKGDRDTLYKSAWLMQTFYTDVNRQIEKFIKTQDPDNITLLAGELKDLCDLALPLLNKFEKKINHSTMYKDLWNCECLNDKHMREWSIKYTEMFSIVAKLRCFLSVISYAWCLLDAYEKQWNNNYDLATVITNSVKNYIKYEY